MLMPGGQPGGAGDWAQPELTDALRMQECKSTTTNGFHFRIMNSLMESWGVRLTCSSTVALPELSFHWPK